MHYSRGWGGGTEREDEELVAYIAGTGTCSRALPKDVLAFI